MGSSILHCKNPHFAIYNIIGLFNFMNMSNLAVKIAVIESEAGQTELSNEAGT